MTQPTRYVPATLPAAGPTSCIPEIHEIIELYNNNLIGIMEARSLIEKRWTVFEEVRDSELDTVLTDANTENSNPG